MNGSRLRRWAADDALAWVLAGVAFSGSFSHLVGLAAAHGVHGALAYATAGCVDAIVAMAARERQRDKRIGRQARGWVSWPIVVLTAGIALTLAGNLARAQHTPWGWTMAGIPATALLLAISMIERRAAHAARREASRRERQPRRAAASDGQAPAAAPRRTPPASRPRPADGVVDLGARGEITGRMRRHWDEQVAAGRVPSGAELVAAAGADPKTSLGRQNRIRWLRELGADAPGAGAADGHGGTVSVSPAGVSDAGGVTAR